VTSATARARADALTDLRTARDAAAAACIAAAAFAGVLDLDKYNAVVKREEAGKAKLRKAAGGVK
jgi:hypothetical protein